VQGVRVPVQAVVRWNCRRRRAQHRQAAAWSENKGRRPTAPAKRQSHASQLRCVKPGAEAHTRGMLYAGKPGDAAQRP